MYGQEDGHNALPLYCWGPNRNNPSRSKLPDPLAPQLPIRVGSVRTRGHELMPTIRAIEREVAVTHAAFGSFLANFASAENTLMALAHNLSRLAPDIAEIVFDRAQRDKLANVVRQAMKEHGGEQETLASIKSCLTHLGHMAKLRNAMAHSVCRASPPGMVLIKFFSRDAFDTTVVPRQDMIDMAADCLAIFARLGIAAFPEIPFPFSKAQMKILHAPWRYKPDSPGRRRQAQPE
jgi:hypothetical protein